MKLREANTKYTGNHANNKNTNNKNTNNKNNKNTNTNNKNTNAIMKIYPTNTVINQSNIDKISSYKYKEDNIRLLFTTSGIMQIQKNKLNRLKVVDLPVKYICLGDYEFSCDESKYVVDCEWFQIPKHHVDEKVNKSYYRMRPGALVDLVMETRIVDGNKNTQILAYFITKCRSISHGVEEDIISFLSIL